MTNEIELLKIPTTYLPEDWREQGAKKFGVSKNTIERVVYGLNKKPKVFAFMLDLAEAGKKAHDDEQRKLMERVNALSQ